jgi:hypothetical protein
VVANDRLGLGAIGDRDANADRGRTCFHSLTAGALDLPANIGSLGQSWEMAVEPSLG